ncbi:MAG: type II toxin-antitoxin system RelE/ParE family toxin [Candidatus Rokubacteria bacterium]|nr:type II toxin-antitoxin system RelE/ParE family toxin [Candidatus Rokubacteria bacterium]
MGVSEDQAWAVRSSSLPEAAREFEAVNGPLKKIAAKQIDKLAERPGLGEPLGKRMGIDLTGYRTIYFGKKGYRIVYEIQRQKLVVPLIGIGKRERAEIYKEVARRLKRSD